jgi:hypothetical protein
MLKERIASLDEVPEALREHYGPAEDGQGGFQLQYDGGALKRALEHERRHRKAAEEQVRQLKGQPAMTPRQQKFLPEAERRLQGLEGEARAAEVAKIEAEMVPLIAAEVAEAERSYQTRIEGQRRTIERLMRQSAATDLVMRIRRPGIEPHVLAALVLDRFELKEEGGEFSVVTKGANGEPMSLEALAEELRATPALAPLVAGSSPEERVAHERKVAETLGQARPNGAAR